MSSLDVIKLLLAKGAEVNLQLKNGQPYRTKLDRGTDGMLGAGTTPLIRAAKAADHVAMKLLLGERRRSEARNAKRRHGPDGRCRRRQQVMRTRPAA